MDDWKKFNEDLYSHLNMEDITDAEFAHTKNVCKDFEIKTVGEYRDVQNDAICSKRYIIVSRCT